MWRKHEKILDVENDLKTCWPRYPGSGFVLKSWQPKQLSLLRLLRVLSATKASALFKHLDQSFIVQPVCQSQREIQGWKNLIMESGQPWVRDFRKVQKRSEPHDRLHVSARSAHSTPLTAWTTSKLRLAVFFYKRSYLVILGKGIHWMRTTFVFSFGGIWRRLTTYIGFEGLKANSKTLSDIYQALWEVAHLHQSYYRRTKEGLFGLSNNVKIQELTKFLHNPSHSAVHAHILVLWRLSSPSK